MLIEKVKLVEGEEILLTVRKHWFILVAQTFSLMLLGIVPVALLFFAFSGESAVGIDIFIALEDFDNVLSFFSAAWFLIIWMMIFGVWTDYYLDIWTVTTHRVIAIDQNGFFRRSIASFRLERMQDLNINVNGIIATALNFGNIQAETASHDDSFIIKGVPDPRHIKSVIQQAADSLITERLRHEHASGNAL